MDKKTFPKKKAAKRIDIEDLPVTSYISSLGEKRDWAQVILEALKSSGHLKMFNEPSDVTCIDRLLRQKDKVKEILREGGTE